MIQQRQVSCTRTSVCVWTGVSVVCVDFFSTLKIWGFLERTRFMGFRKTCLPSFTLPWQSLVGIVDTWHLLYRRYSSSWRVRERVSGIERMTSVPGNEGDHLSDVVKTITKEGLVPIHLWSETLYPRKLFLDKNEKLQMPALASFPSSCPCSCHQWTCRVLG